MKNTIIVCLIFVCFSCKDFLDEEPTGLPVQDEFYDNLNELQLGVNAIYQVLRTSSFQLPYAYIGSAAGDNLVAIEAQQNSAFAQISTLNPTAQDPIIEDFWYANYLGVYRANLVIASAEKIQPFLFANGDVVLREQIGQAKFLRAFFYFNLVRTFGDVPIKEISLSLDGNIDNFKQARSPKEEVYQLIEKDLREAIIALNERWIGPGDIADLGKIGEGHAWNMLLKVLVYQAVPGVPSSKWQEALAVGSHIVDRPSGNVSYREILNYETLYNSDEEELARIVQDLELYDVTSVDNFLDRQAGLGGNNYTVDFQYAYLNREEADFSSESIFEVNHVLDPSGTFNLISPFHDNFAHQNLLQPALTFVTASSGDPRGLISNMVTGTTLPDGSAVVNPPFPEKTACFKWYTLSNERSTVKNFRIMRYAESILFYAEILNETGDQFGAVTQLNRLRARARKIGEADDPRVTTTIQPVDFTVGNYIAVRNEIRKDRRIELCFEFDRFWDLVRTGAAESAYATFNKSGIQLPSRKNFRIGVSELFPIPLAEIDASEGLVIQNPGY